MPKAQEILARFARIPNLQVATNVPLGLHTRFALGGPADVYVETPSADAFVEAIQLAQSSGVRYFVLGEGTNLVVADQGFRGAVLRFTAHEIAVDGGLVRADAGASLSGLVSITVERGLRGLETLAGIPGSVGAAIYGNAGAYGHSISEKVVQLRVFDGEQMVLLGRDECEFAYRESIFKRKRRWVVLWAELMLERADRGQLKSAADDIVRVRNEKFPPEMKCAGSVFKNLLLAELAPGVVSQIPATAVREGKVPAAFFLERVGAKGMSRGDIHVAAYHANLLYNGGCGTTEDLRALIDELRRRVHDSFGVELEEEVQYLGFNDRGEVPCSS